MRVEAAMRKRYGDEMTGHVSLPAVGSLRGQLRRNEPMSLHTSWRAGGAADRAYRPADLLDLQAFLATLPPAEPVVFVGLGSNLLVRDGGLRGTVVFTHRALGGVRIDTSVREIYAEAGVAAPKIARLAAVNDLAGAEFLAGIPGTVGGALAMNAGCYGSETWNIVVRVQTIDRAGVLHERTPAHYRIGYRTALRRCHQISSVSVPRIDGGPAEMQEWFVAATFRLAAGNGAECRGRIRELLTRRIATQPLGEPNAGSVFRNPAGDFAARLIEACGLKGHVIGSAMISRKHANFIVNTGHATAADIEALIDLAEAAVRDRFGIVLEREVRIVGEAAENA